MATFIFATRSSERVKVRSKMFIHSVPSRTITSSGAMTFMKISTIWKQESENKCSFCFYLLVFGNIYLLYVCAYFQFHSSDLTKSEDFQNIIIADTCTLYFYNKLWQSWRTWHFEWKEYETGLPLSGVRKVGNPFHSLISHGTSSK